MKDRKKLFDILVRQSLLNTEIIINFHTVYDEGILFIILAQIKLNAPENII